MVPACMVYAFIAFWVLLGLGVFFVAMRGGPRGARESLHTESRPASALSRSAIVLLFAFGLIVPGFVLAFNAEHKAGVTVGGLHLTAEQQKGRELFAHTCAVCHTLSATNSVGRIGPNLDVRVGDDISHRAADARRLCSTRSPKAARAASARCPPCCIRARKPKQVASFVAAVAGH